MLARSHAALNSRERRDVSVILVRGQQNTPTTYREYNVVCISLSLDPRTLCHAETMIPCGVDDYYFRFARTVGRCYFSSLDMR